MEGFGSGEGREGGGMGERGGFVWCGEGVWGAVRKRDETRRVVGFALEPWVVDNFEYLGNVVRWIRVRK